MRGEAGARRWDVGALFATALAVRLAARVATGFDGLYGQDPFAYHAYALQLRAALASFHAPPPFFWPIGYPLLVVAASLLGVATAVAGQGVSVVAGALVAPLAYLLVREVRDDARAGAWVAGLAAALGAQLLLSSLSVMADACALAWAVASAIAMLRFARKLELRWVAASAFALGWAVLTRWAWAAAVPPWGLAAAAAWRGGRVRATRVALGAAVAVAVGGAVVAVQFVGGAASHVGDLLVVGWNPANAVLATIRNSDGVFHYRVPIGVFYASPIAHPAFVFPLLTPFAIIGALALRKAGRPALVMIAGWLVTVWSLLAGIAWENRRFSLALLPPLLVLVGLGFERVMDAAQGAARRRAVAGACALGLIGCAAWSARDLGRFVAGKDAAVGVARWAEGLLPAGATVVSFELTATLAYYSGLRPVEIYGETPATLAARVCEPRPAYLLLDPERVAAQWSGLAPALNLRWLREKAGLEEVASHGRFTLWRIVDGCRAAPVRDGGGASGP